MKLPKKIVDANVLLRFLLGDAPEQQEQTCTFLEKLEFGRVEALLTDIVLCEVVWVLAKVYKIDRSAIAEKLGKLLGFIGLKTLFPTELYREAMRGYADTTADIQDCLIAALARSIDAEVITFDRNDYRKLGCLFHEP